MKIKIRDTDVRVSQFVSRFELDRFSAGEDDSLLFVIDILKNTESGEFFPKVYLRDFYSIRPSSFTENESESCDGVIIVEDDVLGDWDSIMGDNPDDVLRKVLKVISDKFNE